MDSTRCGNDDSLADSAESRRLRPVLNQEDDNLLTNSLSKCKENSRATRGEFLPKRTVPALRNKQSHSFVLPDCGRWNGSASSRSMEIASQEKYDSCPAVAQQIPAVAVDSTMVARPCSLGLGNAASKPLERMHFASRSPLLIEVLTDGNGMYGKVANGIPIIKGTSTEECVHYDDYYIEETAWRSAMVNATAELLPLLPPSPLPQFPNTGSCIWSFDDLSRVLLGDFVNDGAYVCEEDRQFLFKMMERDDVTVVTQGNAQELNPRVWNLQFMKSRLGTEFHHKFRRFTKPSPSNQKKNPTEYEEIDGFLVMKVASYIDYLEKRERLMSRKDVEELTDEELLFPYHDADDNLKTLHLLNDVVYMIDFDIVKLLPELHQDLVSKLRLPECLPGGQKCMMNAVRLRVMIFICECLPLSMQLTLFLLDQVNQNGRPFMGPNLYVTRK